MQVPIGTIEGGTWQFPGAMLSDTAFVVCHAKVTAPPGKTTGGIAVKFSVIIVPIMVILTTGETACPPTGPLAVTVKLTGVLSGPTVVVPEQVFPLHD